MSEAYVNYPRVVDIEHVDIGDDTPAVVTMSVTYGVRHWCPFVDELDVGEAVMTWDAETKTIELHSLRDYLDGWAGERISHEALTQILFDTLVCLDGIYARSVVTRWTTAGMSVEVRAGA